MSKVLDVLLQFLSSFGFACILLFLLLVLTFFGTLQQVDYGIYDVQKKYFESLFVLDDTLGFPLPLPGAALVLVLLSVNLILGGILRPRFSWSRTGVLVAHLGIVFMLTGNLVKYLFATEGNLKIYEQDVGTEYRSGEHWEIAVYQAGGGMPRREYLIPEGDFLGLERGESVTFRGEELPFDITLHDPVANALPRQADPKTVPAHLIVDGVTLRSIPLAKESEQNAPGFYVTVTDRSTGARQHDILWGAQAYPPTFLAGGASWAIDLRRQCWPLPFTVRLDKFTHEIHPRSGNKSKAFESDVTMIDSGIERPVKISMNAPLRHKGFTLFQSSYGPQDPRSNEPVYSVFAVVNDPAEDMPLYACIVITAGLLVHFTQRLTRYIRTESKRRV
ncbi:MAG: cytochrome c biogenesis protein ResB [Planctomycetota bacterium]